ncbi:MAG: hypothetical protein R3E89_17035 [Thiolinea sp.]
MPICRALTCPALAGGAAQIPYHSGFVYFELNTSAMKCGGNWILQADGGGIG